MIEVANAIPQPSAYFRRQAYEAAGRLDHSLRWTLDYDLWIRLAEHGQMIYIPENLAQLRIYPEAKTSSAAPAMFDEFRAVGERYGGFGLLNQMVSWVVPGLLPKALEALRQGDLEHGQAWLTSVVANDPAWHSETHLAAFLVNWAWGRIQEAGEDSVLAAHWISQVCRRLPERWVAPQRVERRALGLLFEALAFRSYQQGHTRAGLRYAARAVAHDQRRAANRGLWSSALRSLVKH